MHLPHIELRKKYQSGRSKYVSISVFLFYHKKVVRSGFPYIPVCAILLANVSVLHTRFGFTYTKCVSFGKNRRTGFPNGNTAVHGV